MAETKSQFKFRLLRADELEVRVGQVSKPDAKSPWYTLLLYKDARCDMNVLDETVGPFNWQRRHYELKNVLYCSVGVRPDASADFVWKDDAGTESNTEAQKGESSDSFKRACVNWGIGRELYTAPRSIIFEPSEMSRKRSFYVKSITYTNDGLAIASYVVGDLRNPDWTMVFK